MTGQRFSFRIGPRLAAMLLLTAALLSTPGCLSSGGLADLMPGHEEAALRKRVEADSFPSADQALHSPEASNRQGF